MTKKNNNKVELEKIVGAGGSDGGSHTPVDSPNTLVSKTTARVLFLTSDGEIGGLADQTNKLKSVYFNNVPVMNAGGTLNFANSAIDERYGLPSQTVMSGYPSASSTFNVGAKVTTTTAVTYTSSTSAPDAIRVTIRFPALFQQQTNGDTTGTSVRFQIYRALGAGTYVLVKDITKTDKCTSPADTDYLIDRPTGAGTWSVKVVRVTADNSATTLANDIYLQTAAEIQYAQLPYNNRAYVGMIVTAEATGSSFPLISFDLYGLKVKVPSNYTVATRTYSGTWDGLFKTLPEVCDNPAWVLYDLLTNTSHGLGGAISASDIDQYSFYDAAVYCDGSVPALVNGSISGTEPRYTFNYQFMAQDSAWATIQNVAASFGAQVYTSGNRVKLVQDRPTSASRIITNSNVVDGLFEYVSSPQDARSSACIVYWNNPAENWLSVPCYYEDTAGTARYGLNVSEVTGLGITTEGQAMRLAKWHVDTSINNTDGVSFKVGFANAGIDPGEVFKLMDTDYAAVMNEAKVVSSTTSTITLDRPIAVASGNTFDVVGSDGLTIYTRTITSTGTLSTISFSGAVISVSAGADFILTGAVSPRTFKVVGVKEDSPGIYEIAAVEYDPNKFGRVDSTPTGPTPAYTLPSTLPSAPLNLAFRESATNNNNIIQRSLMISWTRPATGTVKNYILRYRRANTTWEEVELKVSSYELQNVLDGQYDVQVFAVNAFNSSIGPSATGSYTITGSAGGVSLLNAPTTLQVNGGGTAFTGVDINFNFTNPSSNASVAATLKDFEVKFIETTGSTLVRTVYVAAVAAAGVQTFNYTYAMNMEDGGPRRSMQVQVRCRDANGNLSSPVTQTFTNASPATITPVVTGGIGSVFVTTSLPAITDFGGFLVWMSLTSGFTPSSGNLVYDGTDSVITLKQLGSGTHYVRFAAYDDFGKDYAGTGLNLSAQLSATPSASAGIPSGSSVPGTGAEGDLFYNTTDGQLYRYHSGAWTVAVPAVNVTGTLTNSQLASIDAAKITSQIVGTQITNGAISTAKLAAGSVTTNEIAANTIVAANIASGTITATQISSGTITATQIAASTITGAKIAANTIAAGNIVAATISSNEIAANTIVAANIASGTITATQLAAGSVTAGKISVSSLSAITASLGNVSGGQYTTGAYTGYAWPAAGAGGGSYLGPSGLLLGSANDGKYFQVESTGNVYGPQFSIVNGAASFSGALSAASGTFSGTLTGNVVVAANIVAGTITADRIVAGGLTTAYGAASAGNSCSVSVTIPSGARLISASAFGGYGQLITGSGENASYYEGPLTVTITSTSSIVTGSGYSSTAGVTISPSAGTYTVTATRSTVGTYYGNIVLTVLVTNR